MDNIDNNKKEKNEIFNFKYTLLPCMVSFIMARIFIEWNLQSRIIWQTSIVFDFLWNSAGYIMATLLILWTTRCNDYYKSLIVNKRISTVEIAGANYSLSLILYFSISSLIYTLFFILARNISFSYDGLTRMTYISIQQIASNFPLIGYILLMILLSSIFKKFSIITKIYKSTFFIYIIGTIWYKSLGDIRLDHFTLLSEKTNGEFYIIIFLIIIYILLNINSILIDYHTRDNNLSEWKSTKLGFTFYNYFWAYIIIFPIIFCFMIGIYY
tara:strand:- start:524 stop:1333 length:810 start_codon:yes stop_codon:yes gene_type:complete